MTGIMYEGDFPEVQYIELAVEPLDSAPPVTGMSEDYIGDYRMLGIQKGPLVMDGWGYDLDGTPRAKPHQMTPENFVYWLNGYFELSGTNKLTELQVQLIKEHLALCFRKETKTKIEESQFTLDVDSFNIPYTC